MVKDSSIKDFVAFQVTRKVTNLTKSFLVQLEDLKDESDILSEDKFLRMRKRALDSLNDALRDLGTTFERVEITLKSNENDTQNCGRDCKCDQS